MAAEAGAGVAAYEAFDAAFTGVPPSAHVEFLQQGIAYVLDRLV